MKKAFEEGKLKVNNDNHIIRKNWRSAHHECDLSLSRNKKSLFFS